MENEPKSLKSVKTGRYATPFDATMNTPMKGDGKIGDMAETCPLQGKRFVVRIHEGARRGETSGCSLSL